MLVALESGSPLPPAPTSAALPREIPRSAGTHRRAPCGLTSSGVHHPDAVATVWFTTGGVKKLLKRPSLFSLVNLQRPRIPSYYFRRAGHGDAAWPVRHTAVRIRMHTTASACAEPRQTGAPSIPSAAFSLPSELSLTRLGFAHLCLCHTWGSPVADSKLPVLP